MIAPFIKTRIFFLYFQILRVSCESMTDLLENIKPAKQAAPQTFIGSKGLEANLISFDEFGATTQVVEDQGIKYFVNEYWTSRQRQANRLHEISYRACFKPQLPEFFISRLTRKGGSVYDPFMGRGTTPLQAALMGRRPIGNDINPLSVMLLRPRLTPPSLHEIHTRLQTISWDSKVDTNEDLRAFYSVETLRQVLSLREYLLQRDRVGQIDHVDDWIRMVAINRLTGHSAGFFSVYTLPPNQACSADRQRKINEKRDQTPPDRDVANIILKKSKSLLSQLPDLGSIDVLLGSAPASMTPYIPDSSVDLVVTSPPFLDVVQYAKDNWLRCWFAGIDADAVPISMHKKVEDWEAFVRDTFVELARLVKEGGTVAFEVGEVRNKSILLERNVVNAIEGLPFDILGVLLNEQEFTKTANCWGVTNGKRGTNSNRIVIATRR